VPDLQCPSCSAPLTLPTDLDKVDVTCVYCKHVTVLPPDLVRPRLAQQAEHKREAAQEAAQVEVRQRSRRTLTFVLVIVIVSTALPLLIVGAVLVSVFSIVSKAVPHPPPVSAPAPPPAHHR
jgi:hypothetical protein